MNRDFFLSLLRLGGLALCCAIHVNAQQQPVLKHSIAPPVVGYHEGDVAPVAVAMNEQYVVVGYPFDDTGALGTGVVDASDTGVVKVFHAGSGELAFVIPSPWLVDEGRFGAAVALSGSKLIVGQPLRLPPGAVIHSNTAYGGSAYVFDLSSPTPTVPAFPLEHPQVVSGDGFGTAIAVSGSKVAVCEARDRSRATTATSGVVHLYDLSSATPGTPTLTIGDVGFLPSDDLGTGLALNGDSLAVYGITYTGLNEEQMPLGYHRIYLFDLTSATPGEPVHELSSSIGRSLALANGRLVTGNAEDVFVYSLTGLNPTTPAYSLTHPSPGKGGFGQTLALEGDRLIVGYLEENEGQLFGYPEAHLFDLGGGTPAVAVQTLASSAMTNPSDAFTGMAISGDSVAIGAARTNRLSIDEEEVKDVVHFYDLSSSTPGEPVHTTLHQSPIWASGFGGNSQVAGGHLVLGAAGGHVFVYDLESGEPTEPVMHLHAEPRGELERPSFSLFGGRLAVSPLVSQMLSMASHSPWSTSMIWIRPHPINLCCRWQALLPLQTPIFMRSPITLDGASTSKASSWWSALLGIATIGSQAEGSTPTI